MSANKIYLTQAEKLNFKNLGVSIKFYGAIGDGNADDTSAFTEALENNSRVYVPGGTYKITGELTVPENCELELARDAVLEFVPSNKRVIVDEETGNKITVNIAPEEFKCITLNPSSRLIGKLATVIVPYNFKGNAIRIASNPEDDTDCNKPRYLKDINIVKLIESGEYEGCVAALDNVTDGTALLIEGAGVDETENPSILWGVEASGLRIAGAFDYGIRCINTNYEKSGKTPWKYETKIDALIDGCRTGVYMDHYNNVRISAAIKTRQAYRVNLSNETSLKYAEHGIHLAGCKYIDLRNSRIIDKDPETDTLTVSDEFKHINLDGVCHGLMIENSLCSRTDGFNVRDYIHTTTAENFEGITILGEPSSRFVEIGNYDTANLYKNYRINSNGDMVPQEGITSTDYISCSAGATVKLKNIDLFAGTKHGLHRIVFYGYDSENDIKKYLFYVSAQDINVNNELYINDEIYFNFNKALSEFSVNTLNDNQDSSGSETNDTNTIKYFRICCDSAGLNYNSSIEVDDDKYAFKLGELKDQIHIKARYIKG